MNYKGTLTEIINLEFDTKKIICIDDEKVELYVIRPTKLPKSLRNKYDPNKNFQIWLKEGKREFKPNHLRVLIDLNLRTRCRPDLKERLLLIFDNIFYGSDPDTEIQNIKNEKFDHFLNSIEIIANLSQLLIIEQEINYTRESNFDPITLFYQGWVREFIDSPKEIDNMCMSVGRFQPPKAQYTNKENKKHNKFKPNLEPLWYIENKNRKLDV